MAGKRYTVAVANHALKSGRWVGDFETEAAAREWADGEAKRTRAFMEYRIHEGTKSYPGKQIGESIKGTC